MDSKNNKVQRYFPQPQPPMRTSYERPAVHLDTRTPQERRLEMDVRLDLLMEEGVRFKHELAMVIQHDMGRSKLNLLEQLLQEVQQMRYRNRTLDEDLQDWMQQFQMHELTTQAFNAQSLLDTSLGEIDKILKRTQRPERE